MKMLEIHRMHNKEGCHAFFEEDHYLQLSNFQLLQVVKEIMFLTVEKSYFCSCSTLGFQSCSINYTTIPYPEKIVGKKHVFNAFNDTILARFIYIFIFFILLLIFLFLLFSSFFSLVLKSAESNHYIF